RRGRGRGGEEGQDGPSDEGLGAPGEELPPSPIGGGQDRRQGPGSPRRAPRHELRAAAEGRLDRAEGLGLQARLRTHAPVQRHALGRGPCAGLPPSPPRAPEERRGPAVCQARAEEHGYGAFGFVVGKRSGWKTCCYKNFSVEEVLDDLIEDGQVTLYYNGERRRTAPHPPAVGGVQQWVWGLMSTGIEAGRRQLVTTTTARARKMQSLRCCDGRSLPRVWQEFRLRIPSPSPSPPFPLTPFAHPRSCPHSLRDASVGQSLLSEVARDSVHGST
ncbi:unnamed protein product, partial [Prorocentrum cordatum]